MRIRQGNDPEDAKAREDAEIRHARLAPEFRRADKFRRPAPRSASILVLVAANQAVAITIQLAPFGGKLIPSIRCQ
jgi:hypothetical protein